LTFELADATTHIGTDKPVPRRHRRAVIEQRRVANDDGRAVLVAHNHVELTCWLSPEELRDRR
jgi:hypothetical protein